MVESASLGLADRLVLIIRREKRTPKDSFVLFPKFCSIYFVVCNLAQPMPTALFFTICNPYFGGAMLKGFCFGLGMMAGLLTPALVMAVFVFIFTTVRNKIDRSQSQGRTLQAGRDVADKVVSIQGRHKLFLRRDSDWGGRSEDCAVANRKTVEMKKTREGISFDAC